MSFKTDPKAQGSVKGQVNISEILSRKIHTAWNAFVIHSKKFVKLIEVKLNTLFI